MTSQGIENRTVLVIEDDVVSAAAMCDILGELGCDTRTATTFDDGLEAARAGDFDLILVDRMLPGGDGIDVIAKLRAAGSEAFVFVVSALGQAENKIEGLNKGADDYLAKPFDPSELKARLRALLRRQKTTAADNDLIAFGDIEIRMRARTLHIGSEFIPLSPKEFKLLTFFVEHEGDVITRSQLLEQVWNLHFDPQTNVVDVHVGRLRRKLETAAKRDVIFTERGVGYIFAPLRDGQDA